MVIEVWRHVAERFLDETVLEEDILQIQSGFSGSVIVKVSVKEAAYALRCWSPRTFPVERILELHRFLNYLKSFSLPVAVPLQNHQTGQSLLKVGEAHWQLEPWLPGSAKSGEQLTAVEIQSMMHTVATIHLASESYVATKNGRVWFHRQHAEVPAVRERFSLIQDWTAQRLRSTGQALQFAPEEFRQLGGFLIQHFQTHASMVSTRLRNFSNFKTKLFPCWRDLWSEHVLFQNGIVSGLIDPTATRIDHVGTDISRLLGSLFTDNKHLWNESLNHYQSVRKLNPEDLELIHVLDQSSVLLSGMTWLDRWERSILDHSQLPAIVERLSVLEKRMRCLGSFS